MKIKMWRKKLCRTVFYVILSLQLISLVERQIFDFLGYMWLPMLANFCNTIIAILAIFGNYQYHTTYLFIYIVWTLCWIGWNTFIVCFYLELGNLELNMDLFSFETRSYSWWLVNGHGCEIMEDQLTATYEFDSLENASNSMDRIALPKTKGCLIEYTYIEVIHAAIQIILAFFGIVLSWLLAKYYYSAVDVKRKKAKKSNNMYSIEYSPQRNENGNVPNGHLRGNNTDDDLYASATLAGRPGTSISNMLEGDGNDRHGNMTPRRVKRRSYTRSSARSAGKVESNKSKSSTHHRSSTRSYHGGMRNKDRAGAGKNNHMNPVNRLIDDQQRLNQKNPNILPASSSQFQNDSSTSNDETRNAMIAAERMYGQINPGFQNSRPNSMVYSINQNDTNSPDTRQQDIDLGGMQRGASNNTEQIQQNNAEYEPSRPPSALTSYSNFHGLRRPLPSTQAGQSIPMATVHTHISGNNALPNRLLQHDAAPSSLGMSINLTQENLMQQPNIPLQPNVNVDNVNASFDDDLPPPPPPLSSSPTAELNHHLNAPSTTGAEEDSDSVNNSSIVAAQQAPRSSNLPVPLERTVAARRSRNEYVNIPQVVQQIQQQNFNRMIERSNAGDNIQRPISSPESNMSVGGYNKGQSNNEAPPLPPHGKATSNNNMHNGSILAAQDDAPNYANAPSAESRLMPPPLPPHDRRNGQSQNSNRYNDQSRSSAIGNPPTESSRVNRYSRNPAVSNGSSLFNNEGLTNINSNSTDQLQNYGDTQTLRADDSRLQFRGAGLALSSQFNAGGMNPNQGNDEHAPSTQNKQSAEPMALSARPHRQITIDYDLQNSNSQQTYLHQQTQPNRNVPSSLGSSSTENQSSVPSSPAKVEPPKQPPRMTGQQARPESSSTAVVEGGGIQHRRTGSGSSTRDNYRSSLRAKHRRDMQEKVLRQHEIQQNNQLSSKNGASNSHSQSSSRILGAIKKQAGVVQNRDEDDYGFTKSPEYGTRVPNLSTTSPAANNSSGLTNGHTNMYNSNSHANQNQNMVNGGGLHHANNGIHNGGASDKWYLRDTMQPIDASQHGGNCKCYRCQRKLTAI